MMIRVHGLPAPQGSKIRNRYGGVREASKGVAPWREAVRAETQRAIENWPDSGSGVPMNGATVAAIVDVTFFFPRPKSHYRTGRNAGKLRIGAPDRPASKRNDLDKLCRAVLDGITEGHALADDGLVVDLIARKRYADGDHAPGCLIYVEPTR